MARKFTGLQELRWEGTVSDGTVPQEALADLAPFSAEGPPPRSCPFSGTHQNFALNSEV